jgi:hypothetical protein
MYVCMYVLLNRLLKSSVALRQPKHVTWNLLWKRQSDPLSRVTYASDVIAVLVISQYISTAVI